MIEIDDSTSWNERSTRLPPPSPSPSLSMSIHFAEDEDDDDQVLLLPPASQPYQRESSFSQRSNLQGSSTESTFTPLVERQHTNPRQQQRKRRLASILSKSSLIFGASQLDWDRRNIPNDVKTSPKGIAYYFFGFMMEDSNTSEDEQTNSEPDVSPWNRLNNALFISFTFTTAAASVPVTLIPSVGRSLALDSFFSARVTESAILGAAMGKFLNGPLGDLLGARRVSLANSLLLAASLLFLSVSWDESSVLWACFLIEFFQAVQWPCVIVILAQHYGGKPFEGFCKASIGHCYSRRRRKDERRTFFAGYLFCHRPPNRKPWVLPTR